MRTIRNSVFETNSSSCHVVTVLSEYDMDRLERDGLLLAIYKSQSEKTMAVPFDEFKFEYELERCRFGYDYDENESKYYDVPEDVVRALASKLWKLLIDNAHGKINNLTENINKVLSKYDFADDFKDKVRNLCYDFADKYELNRLLENIKPYKMPNGETMYFSCHEFEC